MYCFYILNFMDSKHNCLSTYLLIPIKTKEKISFFLLCLSLVTFAQQDVKNDSLILYNGDFEFVEGVYPNFESVRRNTPLPKGRIATEYNYDDNDFFEQVLSKKNLYYYDQLGNKLSIKSKEIWGYSRNGFLFINVEDGFYRITMIGSISHFIAFHTTETYNYNNPYYSPYYSNYPYYTSTPSTSSEMRQYLLDFTTGQLVSYDIEGLEVLLMSDPELHDEFVQLSKRKKKQMKFMYIRKYNERNPLYLIKK